jgi:hypothetical protein
LEYSLIEVNAVEVGYEIHLIKPVAVRNTLKFVGAGFIPARKVARSHRFAGGDQPIPYIGTSFRMDTS